jgi:hypothetical protein
MTLADVYDVQPAQAVPNEVDGPTSASGRSFLGRELARWSSRNSSKGALLIESVKCLQFLAAGHLVDELH